MRWRHLCFACRQTEKKWTSGRAVCVCMCEELRKHDRLRKTGWDKTKEKVPNKRKEEGGGKKEKENIVLCSVD